MDKSNFLKNVLNQRLEKLGWRKFLGGRGRGVAASKLTEIVVQLFLEVCRVTQVAEKPF